MKIEFPVKITYIDDVFDSFSYDTFDEVYSACLFESDAIDKIYDAKGNDITQRMADGALIDYAYDCFNNAEPPSPSSLDDCVDFMKRNGIDDPYDVACKYYETDLEENKGDKYND